MNKLSRRHLLGGALAAGGAAAVGAPLSLFAQPDPATIASGESVAGLADRLQGRLVMPTDPSYDAVRKVWNGMIDRYPLAVARCTGVADVMAAVDYARENELAVTVRGGGHSVSGKAVRDGALMIDLAPMQGIRIDPASKRARAEGGVRWASLDRETLAHDLYVTGGTVSVTGIGGLTLGGGFGWLMRKHGLTCDNLAGADVVTADGELLKASAGENPDLYWALRGGGGNFGVVTSFEYLLHDVAPIVGGMAIYRGDQLRELFEFYREFTANAPDNMETQAGALIGPPETPVEGEVAGFVAVCHSGPLADGERLVEPLKRFGPPVMDFIGPTTYGAIQTMFDGGMAVTTRNYWRSSFMREISDELVDLLVRRADGMPRPGTLLLFEHMGGAISEIGEQETAFANRGANYNVSVLASWLDAAADEQNIAWTRQTGNELAALSPGGAYVNYMAGDASDDEVRSLYEANFDRLVAVKRKYDPENVFEGNYSIRP